MKISFLGATHSVTGSKYLIEHKSYKILVDCGLFQGLKELRLRNWAKFPIPPSSIDAVILTHAHIDHSGYLPRLVKEGFKGKIYCTPATRELCKILLPDTAYLQEEEARYANKKGYSKHHPAEPLFTIDDAYETIKFFRTVPFHSSFEIVRGLNFTFQNAGHILGSANVTLRDGNTSICFSGDIGRTHDPIILPSEAPESIDYLVMESTYGNRSHPQTQPKEEIANIINTTVSRKGTLLIPAFAVGRTQTVLLYLSELLRDGTIPQIPIYLNSPMATNATGIYHDFQEEHKLSLRACQDMCTVATYINSMEESIRLNANKDPKIIVSASGMATGGRVIHHLKAFAPNPNNTLLFTGFQAIGTRGEKIVNGAKSIRIHGGDIPIRAEVHNILSLSAHADQQELLQWVRKIKHGPKKVFITHGEEEASLALQKALKKHFSFNTEIPDYLATFEL